jgi:Ca2+-binding RTX toxin-like protein
VSASYALADISTGLLLNNQGGGVTAGVQAPPAAVALDAGRFAAAWISNSSGSGESIQFGIFNAATRALVPGAITDLVGGTANLYGLSLALLSDGNVALAWAEQAGGTTTYWTAVVHGTTGATVGPPLALASASIVGGAVSIAARADGYVVAYSGDSTPANSPAFVAGFTNAGAADPGFTTFEAIQRDRGVSELSVSVLTDGTIVVVAEGGEGPPGVVIGGVGPSRPVEGSLVGFRYWNPDGTPVLREGEPVSGGLIGSYVDSRIVTAALPNGNVVIAFDSGNTSNELNKLVVMVRGPQGEYIGGGDTFVQAAEDQLWPSIAVLGDSGFAVSWSRRRVSDGSPTGTILTTFLPDGTSAPGDTIRSSAASDVAALVGFTDGRLVLVAQGGNDGAGTGIIASLTRVTESIDGTNDDDLINGTNLANRITGFAGADVINGLGGDDLIGGDDSFTVGGADVINGGDGSDTLSGMAADDTLSGGDGDDSLDGGNGNDVLRGDAGNDTLFGTAGADVLDGGTGADSMEGGRDNDIYFVDNPGDVILERVNQGYDRVISSITYRLGVEVEWLSLSGTAALNGSGNALANRIDGNSAANNLNGNGGNDTLYGAGGNDTLIGGPGNSVLDGGRGADSMAGGSDNDTYVVDDIGDLVVELPGGGYDRVVASISQTLGAELEWLTLTGTADLDGTGNALANRLDGNAGNNTLYGDDGTDALFGLAGNDTLLGGFGQDTLDGGLGDDSMVGGDDNDTYVVREMGDVTEEAVGGGYDRVLASLTHTLAAELEWLTLTGTANLDGTGNALANRLDGNAGNNTLDGDDGNDALSGFAGNDTLLGGDGQDTLDGGPGVDSMVGGAANDVYVVRDAGDVIVEVAGGGYDRVVASINHTLAAEVEWLTLSGTANTNGTGNGLANRLEGNVGNNTLDGGEGHDGLFGLAGNDTLLGGGGSDTMDGGQGTDSLVGGLGADIFLFRRAAEADGDVVADFSVSQGDRIDLRIIDADSLMAGDQAFAWIGGSSFSAVAGELRFATDTLEGDVNGDGLADFQISLTGVASLTVGSIWL